MPTTVAVTFTAMPSSGGTGIFILRHCTRMGVSGRCSPWWALDLNREHRTIAWQLAQDMQNHIAGIIVE